MEGCERVWIYIAIVTIVSWQEATSLTFYRVKVPHYTEKGKNAVLQCEFEEEDDSIYSVKWYKDNEEFYRFVPREKPPIHTHKVEGARVDHHSSTMKDVVLKNVNLKSAGMYRCEVSAEKPSFKSFNGEGRMHVVSLPKQDPIILGQKEKYRVGDILNLNCTSGKSFPPPTLRWEINDRDVSREALIEYDPIIHSHGLVTMTLGLMFEVMPQHIHQGAIKVRCVTTISAVFWEGNSESVMASQREEQLIERVAQLIMNGAGSRISASLVNVILLASLAIISSPEKTT